MNLRWFGRAEFFAMFLACLMLVACGDSNVADDDSEQDEDNASTDEGAEDEPDDESIGMRDAGRDSGRGDAGRTDAGRADAGARSDGGGEDASGGGTDGGGRADAGGMDASGDAEPEPGNPGPEPEVVSGCGAAKLYQVNEEDTGALGPWPVGVKTVSVPFGGGALTAEVWYPAKRGSEQGKPKEAYDLRKWLPEGAAEIPDSANRLAECECYRDLPLDADHGPYPAVVFIHGLGSMRVSSGTATALWASRGFIVVAADHPGDMLTDFLVNLGLGSGCTNPNMDFGDMATEAGAVLDQLSAKEGDFAFLGDAVDTTRVGLAGHSQGGQAVASMAGTPNVKVIITLAPLGGGAISAPVDSLLQVTGTIDSVTGYSTSAYLSSPAPLNRHVGILNGGHIDVTDLCKTKNPQGLTAIEVAREHEVCGALALSFLAQCGGDPAATESSPIIVNYATTAALEETLQCKDRSAAWSMLESKFPDISEFLHTP